MEDRFYSLLSYYSKLPMPFKKLLSYAYGTLPFSIRYGKFYEKYFYRVRSNNFDSSILMNATIKTALMNLEFYSSYTKSVYNISELPIINKHIIKNNIDAFINWNNAEYKLKANTGGSSGTPFEFYLHKGLSRVKERAHFDWYWGQFGYKANDRTLMIRGMPLNNNKLYEYQPIDNKLIISSYLINEENLSKVFSKINKFKPLFIHGYPSSVKNFTKLLQKKSFRLNNKVKALLLGSENLEDYDRKNLEGYYECRAINWYGHSERLVHAGNCSYSNEFHIYKSYGFLELLDKNGNIIEKPNKIGRIVATGYDNYVMPFIRYDTEDLGEYSSNNNCECGFQGVSLKQIHGRVQDYIILKDGTNVSTTAFVFGQHLPQFPRIKEIQLEQSKIGSLIVRIVKEDDFSIQDEKKLLKQLLSSVDNKLTINFDFVDFIPKTKNGKHRFLVNNIF